MAKKIVKIIKTQIFGKNLRTVGLLVARPWLTPSAACVKDGVEGKPFSWKLETFKQSLLKKFLQATPYADQQPSCEGLALPLLLTLVLPSTSPPAATSRCRGIARAHLQSIVAPRPLGHILVHWSLHRLVDSFGGKVLLPTGDFGYERRGHHRQSALLLTSLLSYSSDSLRDWEVGR